MNEYLFKTGIEKPVQSAQKFHRLITKGIQKHTGANLKVLSAVPVVPSRHNRVFWIEPNEIEDGVRYGYIPMLNIKIVKNISVFISCFIKVLLWCLKNTGKKRILITDVLNLTTSAAAILACKITFTKTIGILTDMPGLMVTTDKNSLGKIVEQINSFLIARMSGFVFLTEQMNYAINKKNRPYIIMEGLVDANMINSQNDLSQKYKEKVVIYAGGLYEKYGVKKLIEGFIKLKDKNTALHLYGEGPMVKDIEKYSNLDNRIRFGGMVPNEIVVEEQIKATLLVNPRPSNEEFTKYSFPSKNMEYMVSGTPVVTPPLPGMPKEYNKYVYVFQDESEHGICSTLNYILSQSSKTLHDFGGAAKQFVLDEKNNLKQAARIVDLAYKLVYS